MLKNLFLLTLLLLLRGQFIFSQKSDSANKIRHFSGSVSITHNGISLIPTFSLGKPASIIMLSMGGERFSFDPDLRFALEGKPWSMLFWFRYRLVNSGKFRLGIGAHPALNFRSMRLPVNGDSADVILARRFLAAEIAPGYQLSENVSVGIYYLGSKGFDINVPKTTHFLTLNSTIANIPLPAHMHLRLNPQVYWLKQDKNDGFYFTATVTLTMQKFPLSVSAIFNKELSGDIPGSKDFVWNTSLVYSFSKKYAGK